MPESTEFGVSAKRPLDNNRTFVLNWANHTWETRNEASHDTTLCPHLHVAGPDRASRRGADQGAANTCMTICTAETKSGRPCKAHAMRGTEPPRCVVHRQVVASPDPGLPPEGEGDLDRDLLAAPFAVEELADLVAKAADDSLQAEVTAVRIVTQQLLKRLSQKLDPDEFKQLTRLLFTGANTMVRLLRAQRDLSPNEEEDFAKAFSQALDALGEELGVEL